MRHVLALVLLVAATAFGDDAPVAVRARVEPDTVAIGRRFRYLLEVESAPGAEVVVAQPSEHIGDFDIVDFGIEPPIEQNGRTLLRRWYALIGYTPGQHVVKSPPVQFRPPGEELRDVTAAETQVTIASALHTAGTVTDIRDIKAPEPVPVDWRPYYLLGGGLVALALVALVLHRVLTRPRRVAAVAPPRPAHEIAAEALERLRQRRLIEEGAFKEYYSTLSGIVRAYVEQRFDIRAPEMTTEEFLLVSARSGKLVGPHRALLADFLTESDLVKFARHLPAIADSERAFTAARRFVDETAASPAERLRAAG
jgi:hypothetical protein